MMRMIGVLWVLTLMVALSLTGCGSASSDSSGEDAERLAERVTLPPGTRLSVTLSDGVSTNTSSPGDVFMASLAAPVEVGGKTVLEKGAAVQGRVVDVQEPGRVKGLASLRLVLTSVVRDGQTVSIVTNPYVGVARNTKKRDAGIIGGAAGVGAAIGAIAGGGKGALKGAAIGGGAGTGTVLATKGEQLHYPPETRLSFTLAKPAAI